MGVDYYLCPGCDREVRVGSRGCPYCHPPAKRRKRPKATAKRIRRSWEGTAAGDGLDLPDDDDFDYDDFIAREFGGKASRRHRLKWYWWLTGVLLLALIVLAGFRLAGWGTMGW